VCANNKIYDYRDFAQVRHFKKDERFVDLDVSSHRLYISGKCLSERERASRNGSTVVEISIPPPSCKFVSWSLSRISSI